MCCGLNLGCVVSMEVRKKVGHFLNPCNWSTFDEVTTTPFVLHPTNVGPHCLDVSSQWPFVDLTTYQLWPHHT